MFDVCLFKSKDRVFKFDYLTTCNMFESVRLVMDPTLDCTKETPPAVAGLVIAPFNKKVAWSLSPCVLVKTKCSCMYIQGDPNQNLKCLLAMTLKLTISVPMLVKPKCI